MDEIKVWRRRTERMRKDDRAYQRERNLQGIRFGLDNRLRQVSEECAELIQAVMKYQRAQENDKTLRSKAMSKLKLSPLLPDNETIIINNISEEIADVELCIEQIKYLMNTEQKVDHIKRLKLERTKKLLEGE